jgi:hypothetical protein
MNTLDRLSALILSEESKKRAEKVVVIAAIVSFLIHLLLIFLVDQNFIEPKRDSPLLHQPTAAIYTPFSIILFYEVYLLVYHLPQSITNYIAKQYEIIALIVIRRIFKDLSNIKLEEGWFSFEYNLKFTYDVVAILLIFFLVFLFYRLKKQAESLTNTPSEEEGEKLQAFIRIKKFISLCLAPVLAGLALYNLGFWIYESFISVAAAVNDIRDVNKIFFDDFFTILILIDVLLLLISLINTDQFRKVIRNSGFVISTIMIKLSFSSEGLLNNLLIIAAVLFGVIILWIHNMYERMDPPKEK